MDFIQLETHDSISPLVSELWKTEKIPEIKLYQSSLLSLNKTDFFNHTIKWPGENLGIIARWYTGSFKNWMYLVEANPGINPRRIEIGDSILIPKDLMKTRRPMPIEFLLSATSKRNTTSSINKPEYFTHKVKWLGENLGYIARCIPDHQITGYT